MEEYSNHLGLGETNNNNNNTRGNFLYPSATSPSVYGRTSSGSVNVTDHQHQQQQLQLHMNNYNTVKVEGSPSHRHMSRYPIFTGNNRVGNHHHHHQQQVSNNVESSAMNIEDPDVIKAKIIAHPHYSNLLEAYMDCQKVGAPPEVVSRLAVVRQEFEERQRSSINCGNTSKDPELDQFMEAYCDMLVKYREELTRPIQEAMDFMQRIESQLNMISTTPIRIFNSDEKCEGMGSSEEDQEMNNSGGETELPEIDPRAEDRELKNHLLRKYSGYLGSLKQELSKKKKKGKLPKDARQKLLSWWELHYKWPYPSESEKVALAESTGLDQKQINNWFINQRKRHWKPSEDLQFMVMDGLHPQNTALYMDGHYMSDGPYRLGP